MLVVMKEVDVGGGKMGYELKIEFENELEADQIFNNLREGFPLSEVNSSVIWLNNDDNKPLMMNMFTQIWVLIKLAKTSPNHEYFNRLVKVNTFFEDICNTMPKEAARLMLVLVDSASKTKQKRVSTGKDIKKRLGPFKELLQKNAGEDFIIFPLKAFPEIKEVMKK